MIRLIGLDRFKRVFVLAGGPSNMKALDDSLFQRGDLVIGTNRNAALLGAPRFTTRISLSCDVPHVRNTTLPPGILGLYVTADGQPPRANVDGSSYHAWIPCAGKDHWDEGFCEYLDEGVYMGGGSGYAALNFAGNVADYGGEIHCYGFDGGNPPYDRLRERTDRFMDIYRQADKDGILSFYDHSERA